MGPLAVSACDPRPVVGEFARPLSLPELGCIASFATVCRQIAAGNDDFVCILEDDAALTVDTLPFLRPELLATLPRFDLLWIAGDLGPTAFGAPISRHGFYQMTVPLRAYYCAPA